jgi:hypothetical protein
MTLRNSRILTQNMHLFARRNASQAESRSHGQISSRQTRAAASIRACLNLPEVHITLILAGWHRGCLIR